MNQNFKMETKQEVKNKFRFDEDLDLPLSVVLTEFSSKVMTRSRSSKVKYMEESDEDYNPKSKKKSPSRSPTKSPKKEPKTEFPEESKPVVSVKIPKSKRWQCKKCFSLFSTERKLKAHRKANKEGRTNCSYFYNDTEQLYTCVICSAKTGTVDQMKKHVMKEHGERFKCATCGKTFALLFFYAVHLKNKHTHESCYKCPACNFESVVKDDLRNHISILHPKRTKYPCDLCGRVFGYLISYQEHRNEHLGIKPFICEVCNMDFVVLQKLQTHQILCHTVLVEGQLLPFQCHLCKKIFANTETLSKHISDNHLKERDNDKKKHLCDACGKGFATADKLRVHYRIHTGVKPFACRGCEKRFSKKDYLVMHERIHTGEKPYVCNFCGKCFNQSAPLRIHERMHTGERPYVCEICNFGYISRASLNVHAKVCKGGILTSWT